MYLRIFHIICFIIFSIFNVVECNEVLTKQQQWDKQTEEVDSWIDSLGYPIDQGIKDTVVVLNLLGLTTRQSCEGHLDHGDANPWIDFTLVQPEVLALQNTVSEFVRVELKEQLQALKIKFPRLSLEERLQTHEGKYLKPKYEKFLYLLRLYQQEAKRELAQLFELLEKFYQIHNSSEDEKLFLQIEGIIRLSSHGSEFQANRLENERETKLKLYLEEMKGFTSFLKEHFFHQN